MKATLIKKIGLQNQSGDYILFLYYTKTIVLFSGILAELFLSQPQFKTKRRWIESQYLEITVLLVEVVLRMENHNPLIVSRVLICNSLTPVAFNAYHISKQIGTLGNTSEISMVLRLQLNLEGKISIG